jgi:hypothetical protein
VVPSDQVIPIASNNNVVIKVSMINNNQHILLEIIFCTINRNGKEAMLIPD